MKPTRDHGEIRAWAAKTGAHPAEIVGPGGDGHPRLLSFSFGGEDGQGERLNRISWDDFFARFDLLELSLAWNDGRPEFQIVRVSPAFPDGLVQ